MSENSVVDLDALARKLMREHNQFIKAWEFVNHDGSTARGFLVTYPGQRAQWYGPNTRVFPAESYVLPILKVPTTARDVLLWLEGRLKGKHSDDSLRA